MRIGLLLGIAVGVTACAESPIAPPLRVIDQSPALSAATSSSQVTKSLNQKRWVSCANDGAGEFVKLTGELEIRTHAVTDENGGTHLWSHYRPSGVEGVGQVTGTKYRGTGGTFEGESYDAEGNPGVYTMVNNFRLIGQGRGGNLLMHMTVHQAWNADGELTADVDLTDFDCR